MAVDASLHILVRHGTLQRSHRRLKVINQGVLTCKQGLMRVVWSVMASGIYYALLSTKVARSYLALGPSFCVPVPVQLQRP